MKTHDGIKKGLEVCNIWMVDEPNRCMECPYFRTKDCADTLMKHALALIQQLEVQVPRWIPVEERLPDAKLAVLGYGVRSRRYREQDPFPSAHIVYTRGEDEGWFTYWNSEHVKVTRWMPLPELPEGESPVGGNSDDFVHGNHG